MSHNGSNQENQELINLLNEILADISVVYYKTHGFHWNVEGPNFYSLHLMFEGFYKTLWESIDLVAERIRALGGKAPASYRELLKHSSIREIDNVPTAPIMTQNLRNDYLSLAKKTQSLTVFSETQGDFVTANIMTENTVFLEKAAWMLHSSFTR